MAETVTVLGLDLSLVSTGVASSRGWVDRIRAGPGGPKFARHRRIRSEVMDYARGASLVVVEGMALGTKPQPGLDQRSGLWWMVMDAVDAAGLPWLEAPPSVIKKYATGKGNASKDEVLAAAVRRFPEIEVRGNDEADALWLAAIGAELHGEPMVDLPAVNRGALVKLRRSEELNPA